ncbi:MAG: NYN domain-containing protein [Thermodesulfobacteriota bacterium]
MHLIIDGYNLLHVNRSLIHLSPVQLQWERERLINQLLAYQKIKLSRITVVFDGWQGGWATEKRESQKGIEVIYSKLGEKADEVIKRLVKEKGSAAIVITSDRDIARFAQRMAVSVIPSDQFRERVEISADKVEENLEEDEETGVKRKGPSKRLSKKEKRARAALKKL